MLIEIKEGTSDWRGISIDWYIIENDNLGDIYKEIVGENLPIGLQECEALANIYVQSLPHFDKVMRKGDAETIPESLWSNFMLEIKGGIPILPPYTHLYDEFIQDTNRKNYYHFLSIFGHRRDGIKVIKHFIDETGFKIKVPEMYRNYDKFNKTCTKLIDELFEPYVAPSLAVENKLAQIGFKNSNIC